MGKGKIKVVLPMAGRGSRFAEKGFRTPKPLIEVAGEPMLFWALKSLGNLDQIDLIVVALEEHNKEFDLKNLLASKGINAKQVLIPEVTEGQLCTILCAREHLEANDSVLVIPSDTYIDSDILEEIETLEDGVEGLISVYNLPGDRWSFAVTDSNGDVVRVAEKERISDHASTGIYYFKNAGEFLALSDEMIAKEEKTKGEYFVIPIYNKMIEMGRRVRISEAKSVHDMGTPDTKEAFEQFLNPHNAED